MSIQKLPSVATAQASEMLGTSMGHAPPVTDTLRPVVSLVREIVTEVIDAVVSNMNITDKSAKAIISSPVSPARRCSQRKRKSNELTTAEFNPEQAQPPKGVKTSEVIIKHTVIPWLDAVLEDLIDENVGSIYLPSAKVARGPCSAPIHDGRTLTSLYYEVICGSVKAWESLRLWQRKDTCGLVAVVVAACFAEIRWCSAGVVNHMRVSAEFAAPSYSWLTKEAAAGCMYAQCFLGLFAEVGIIEERNRSLSLQMYQLSANQGYSVAQCRLGRCFTCGELFEGARFRWAHWLCGNVGVGIEMGIDKGIRYYRQAAVQGDVVALCMLGDYFLDGQKVPKDVDEAIALYRVAALVGYSTAQYNLGYCYEHGCGNLRSDASQAIHWYSRSAGQNHYLAQYRLAKFLLQGRCQASGGTDIVAYKLLARAAGPPSYYMRAQFALGPLAAAFGWVLELRRTVRPQP
jgi:TPR repeat protein